MSSSDSESTDAPRRDRPVAADADTSAEYRAVRQRYLDVLATVDAIVWEWDVARSCFTFVSDGAERILGYPAEQFIADPELWRGIMHPDDHERALELRNSLSDHMLLEYRAITAAGETIWLRDEIRAVRTRDQVALLRGVATDITERRRAEEALRASRDFYFSLFDDFPAMIWRSDEDGGCDYFNRAWLEFSGTELEDELGDGWLARVHEDDRSEVSARWRAALAHRQPFTMEYRLRHASGEYRPVLDMGRPFHDPQRQQLGYAGAVFDLSEQRALEQQLQQVQKIEAVGRLAGGIAHDFNNILTAIQGHAELALERCDEADPVRDEVEEIRRAAGRAAGLTRQLLAFSRKQVLRPTVFELGGVVADMEPMLRRLIAESIELEFSHPPADARVHADRGQIEQVLLNLVVNARDAMPAGGVLSVAVDTRQVESDAQPAHAFIPPGDYVRLVVSDTGTGMDAATLNRIFEPFFTTKEPGRGTGLGLAMAYGIVKQSGGFILADSEPGKGSTFEVLLHRVAAPAEAEPEGAHSVRRLTGGEAVLVVEDEPAVRRLIARTLTSKGYRVLEAGDADAALALLDSALPPRMLITDIVLPRTSGTVLAGQLAERLPDLRILLISGFPRNHIAAGIPATWGFMEKPFTPYDLLVRVRSMLDA